ncbi:amidase signature enzyme [Lophiostoma macrostomum CBS 122681]|uniref:Amidase signature enzyme n=1 Tax=Lophiostoma macrostomum CBS 122681 TaxID=1314788 RepID=A0A6A6TG81_9PLEO|nr:amidase signature enzyme [Lophiostoma macrostomum CBS 122681]
MNTSDKMQTTCGSWALLGAVFPREAFIVRQLRKAGAVVLGHTNMNEWASLRSTWYSDGYSPRGGQVRNPYDLSRSPFGSSAGSAVAVSTSIVPLTFATETDGSVAGPAQINAVVGIKPTPGLTSRDGIIPTSETMDTVGPMARSVRDAAIGLDSIVGTDTRDSLTESADVHREADYSKFVSTKEVLKGAKFGLPIKGAWSFVSDDQREVAQVILDGIKQAGAEIFEVDYPSADDRIAPNGKWDWELGGPSQSEFTVVKVEAYNGISNYLSELSNTEIRTFEDIIHFNEENTGTEGAKKGGHPAFATGQDIFVKIAEHKGQKDQTYSDALEYIRRKTREEGIDGALRHVTKDGVEIQLDSLILCDWRLVGQQIAAQAGYPTITLPIGVDKDGMPIGLTLQQTAWKEGPLIKWGSAIEDVRNDLVGGRSLPTYRDHLAKNIPIGRKHIVAAT